MKQKSATVLLTALVLGGSVAAAPISSADPGSADSSRTAAMPRSDDYQAVETSDGNPGGKAGYNANRPRGDEYLKVWDQQADGWAARAYLYSWSNRRDEWVRVATVRTGGNGSSNAKFYNVLEGRKYRVQACLVKNGNLEFCNNAIGTA